MFQMQAAWDKVCRSSWECDAWHLSRKRFPLRGTINVTPKAYLTHLPDGGQKSARKVVLIVSNSCECCNRRVSYVFAWATASARMVTIYLRTAWGGYPVKLRVLSSDSGRYSLPFFLSCRD